MVDRPAAQEVGQHGQELVEPATPGFDRHSGGLPLGRMLPSRTHPDQEPTGGQLLDGSQLLGRPHRLTHGREEHGRIQIRLDPEVLEGVEKEQEDDKPGDGG